MRALPALLLLVACTGTPAPPPAEPPVVVPEPEPAPDAEVPPIPDVPLTEARYAATHVLIAWQGATGAQGVTRSRAEALELARSIRTRALAGEVLEDLARAHSDGPTRPRGGALGVYARNTMVPEFERAVASVAVGEIAPLVESPFGFHIVRRDAVVEAHLAHIQVSWSGTWRSSTRRTRLEANARIAEAQAALAAGEAFDAVAKRLSDDPSAAINGGDLGLVAPGQLVPTFETAAFALEVGQTSDVVETPYGLHLIRRLE